MIFRISHHFIIITYVQTAVDSTIKKIAHKFHFF